MSLNGWEEQRIRTLRRVGPSVNCYGSSPSEYQEPIFGPGHSQHTVPREEIIHRGGSLAERIKKIDNG